MRQSKNAQVGQTISLGPGYKGKKLDPSELLELVKVALNTNPYSFTLDQSECQPYHGIFYDGNYVDVYIYIWNITSAMLKNPNKFRIQLDRGLNNVGLLRDNSATQKTLLLGVYKEENTEPVFSAWESEFYRSHKQNSCYVLLEELTSAINGEFVSEKHGCVVYAMRPEKLGDYVSLLQPNNSLKGINNTVGSIGGVVRKVSKPSKKKAVIRSIEELQKKIDALTTLEQDVVRRERRGQGYLRDLLIEKNGSKCALCPITTKSMLRASHIKAWQYSDGKEKLDENNALLLCAHHDAMFDKYLISFEDNGKLIISPSLSPQERIELNIQSISGLSLSMGKRMKEYMAFHRAMMKK